MKNNKFCLIPNTFIILLTLSISFICSSQDIDEKYSHALFSNLQITSGPLVSNKAVIPFGYEKIKMCNSEKIIIEEDILSELISGQLFSTGYKVELNKNYTCQLLCIKLFTNEDVNILKQLINKEYSSNFYMDNLPAGRIYYNPLNSQIQINYFQGTPLGFKNETNGNYYIFNHLQIHISINKNENGNYSIVEFAILPMSINHKSDIKNTCQSFANYTYYFKNDSNLIPQEITTENILFTYDIVFKESNITFNSRWKNYTKSNSKIRWAEIFYSYLLIIILSVIIYLIVSKNIQRDIDLYNYRIVSVEIENEQNWGHVAGDVFRPPSKFKMLLSSLLGTSIQLFGMLINILILGGFGFMNPDHQGKLFKIIYVSFCLMSLPAGFVSCKIYKIYDGKYWFKNCLLTTFLLPNILFIIYLIINFVFEIEKSDAIVEFKNVFSFYVLWIICTFPLILMGSFLGIKTKKIELPYKTNVIPGIIPKNFFFYLKFMLTYLITGLISFCAIFLELNYVMSALWKHESYYLATFICISFILFFIVNTELSVVVIYWQLSKGDYKWWWKSFIIGSSPSFYFVFYSVYFYLSLKITKLTAMVIYFGITGLVTLISIILFGGISTIVSFGFINKIYSQIKTD